MNNINNYAPRQQRRTTVAPPLALHARGKPGSKLIDLHFPIVMKNHPTSFKVRPLHCRAMNQVIPTSKNNTVTQSLLVQVIKKH